MASRVEYPCLIATGRPAYRLADRIAFLTETGAPVNGENPDANVSYSADPSAYTATRPSESEWTPQPYFLPRSLARRHALGFEKNSSHARSRSASGIELRSAHTVKMTSSDVWRYGASAIISKVRAATEGFAPEGGTSPPCAVESVATAMNVST